MGRAFSRGERVTVARGSMAYSAVTQPLPLPRRNCGTVCSTEAAHSTRVLPTSISAEPSAVSRYPVWISHRTHLVRRSPVSPHCPSRPFQDP